jgi:hypothetical protein
VLGLPKVLLQNLDIADKHVDQGFVLPKVPAKVVDELAQAS